MGIVATNMHVQFASDCKCFGLVLILSILARAVDAVLPLMTPEFFVSA